MPPERDRATQPPAQLPGQPDKKDPAGKKARKEAEPAARED
jgi:hypothetical protein